MTGTDSPVIPGAFPGASLPHDLRTLLDIGLTPFEAISAATRTPGEFIARYLPSATPFGIVEPGMRADLLHVAENPLVDTETLESPLSVMSRSRWRTRAELAAALTALAARFDSEAR